jgi:hypothetical protein
VMPNMSTDRPRKKRLDRRPKRLKSLAPRPGLEPGTYGCPPGGDQGIEGVTATTFTAFTGFHPANHENYQDGSPLGGDPPSVGP